MDELDEAIAAVEARLAEVRAQRKAVVDERHEELAALSKELESLQQARERVHREAGEVAASLEGLRAQVAEAQRALDAFRAGKAKPPSRT
jgi:chromosome segregation ATPase